MNKPLPAPRFAPATGTMPALQWCLPDQLKIDQSYQRSLDTRTSQELIRRIASRWDWSLCQPLAVAARADGLYVVDGQHRLEAAKARGDIPQLPCVVTLSTGPEAEAATFVAINQARRALTHLDIFKADLAAGNADAATIAGLITDAGLELARHTNNASWKPGWIGNVGGIKTALGKYGEPATRAALIALAEAYPGEVLRYAGTLTGGLVAFYADALADATFDPDLFIAILSGSTQSEWHAAIGARRSETHANAIYAGHAVFTAAYAEASQEDAA